MDSGIGLLGYGDVGRAHALAWRSLPVLFGEPVEIRLAGVYDPDPERRRLAEQAGFAWSTDDPDELIGRSDVTVIDIALPAAERPGPIRSAMAAGKHLYCEGLLGADVRDAEEIAALADRVPGRKQTAAPLRFTPAFAEARRMVEADSLGETYRMSIRQSIRACPGEGDGFAEGVLEELGVPAMDLARWLAGEVEEVCATLCEAEADSSAAGLLRFASGCEGIFDLRRTIFGPGEPLRIELFGPKGALRLSTDGPDSLEWMPAGGDGWSVRPAASGLPEGMGALGWRAASQHAFVQAITAERAAKPGFRDALMAHRMIDSIYSSASENTWQPVDLGR